MGAATPLPHLIQFIYFDMRKALAIGCPGSGKSYFARKLSGLSGLPLCCLDMLWHRQDRTTASREEFDSELANILARDRWIIDGNFQRTLAWRLECCDTVFLFDLPLEDCLAGVESRIGSPRPDMPWMETEFDPDFRQWIIDFRTEKLPKIQQLLANASCDKIIFRSRQEADAYLCNFHDSPK